MSNCDNKPHNWGPWQGHARWCLDCQQRMIHPDAKADEQIGAPTIGIDLFVRLPERYALVSIQLVNWRGIDHPHWAVCVKQVLPEPTLSEFYGLGEDGDLNEATRKAVLCAEQRQYEPREKRQVFQTAGPARTFTRKSSKEVEAPIVDTSNLDLTL